MNILFLTTHANTGGITSYILTLGGALVKAGHKVWVVSSGGDCEQLIEQAGIRHVKINIRTKSEVHPKVWLSLPFLKNFIQKENIEIIHAQTRVTQVLGTVLSRMTKAAMVTTCHGFFRPRWFRRTFPCWGRGVIAISKPVARHLSNDLGVASNRIHLIFNGIDLDRFKVSQEQQRRSIRQEWGIGEGPLIGIIARLSDVKGIDILIKAMPLILKQIPTAELMIVGQGPEEGHLRKLAQDLSLTKRVHFRNTINQTHLILCAFDVFVMPSIMEGLGLSVMEAQACGIPVVASRVGGLIDLIENGVSGLLVEPRDVPALAGSVVKVLSNPNTSRSMAQQARSHIERLFSADTMVGQSIQIYEQYTRR